MTDTKRNLVNETISELIIYINNKELPVGTKLPNETILASTLNVGRSTLREAVKILAFSNVLDVRHGSGTYIKNLAYTGDYSSDELLTAREMLETQAVTSIITYGFDPEEMLTLKEKLFLRNQLLENGKFSEYVTADLAFHQKIIELAKNPFLAKWYEEIKPELKTYLSGQVLKLKDYADNTEIHNDLYQALIDGNKEQAVKLIKQNSYSEK